MLVNFILLSIGFAINGLAVSIGERVANIFERGPTIYNGQATYYDQQGGTGSCGQAHSDSDLIIALSSYWQGPYPPKYCNTKIKITNEGGGQSNPGTGRTVIATVVDTCPGCDANHLDLSHGAFQALTNGFLNPPGTFSISWYFCDANGNC